MSSVQRPKAWLAWSSGKDSAWALHTVRQTGQGEIVALLTTINRTYQRVAMHAVRETLVEMQAAAAGLTLIKVPIPSPCPNETYEQAMRPWRRRRSKVFAILFSAIFFSRTYAPTAKSNSPRAA